MKIKLLISIGIMGALLLVDYFKIQDLCSFTCSRNFDDLFLNWFVLSAVVTGVLLLLLFFPQRVYLAWWKFTKVGLPVLFIVVTILIVTMSQPRGGFTFVNFDLYFLYFLFILGSLIQIYRGFRNK